MYLFKLLSFIRGYDLPSWYEISPHDQHVRQVRKQRIREAVNYGDVLSRKAAAACLPGHPTLHHHRHLSLFDAGFHGSSAELDHGGKWQHRDHVTLIHRELVAIQGLMPRPTNTNIKIASKSALRAFQLQDMNISLYISSYPDQAACRHMRCCTVERKAMQRQLHQPSCNKKRSMQRRHQPSCNQRRSMQSWLHHHSCKFMSLSDLCMVQSA